MNRTVEALAATFAHVRNITRARSHQLPGLLSARDCPGRFLEGLGPTVGLTSELRLVGHLDTDLAWRRAIDMAPSMFGESGGLDILRDVVRAYTGARMSVFSWHQLATIFVAPAPVFPWFATVPLALNGDYYTEAHVEDLDGLLDSDVVIDAINAIRASGEVVRMTETLYQENWDSLFRWQTNAFATLPGQYLRLLNLGFVRETHAWGNLYIDSRWEHVAYRVMAHIFAPSELRVRVRDNLAGSYYELRVAQAGANNVQIYRGAALQVQATVAIPQGDFSTNPRLYHTFIELQTTPQVLGALRFDAVIDGAPVLTYTDPAPFAVGPVTLTASGGVLEVDWFEIMPFGATVTLIGG